MVSGARRAPGPAARTLTAAAAADCAAQDGELCDENGELGPGEFENVMRQQAPPAPKSPAPSNAPQTPQLHNRIRPAFRSLGGVRGGDAAASADAFTSQTPASLKRPNPEDAPTSRSSPYTWLFGGVRARDGSAAYRNSKKQFNKEIKVGRRGGPGADHGIHGQAAYKKNQNNLIQIKKTTDQIRRCGGPGADHGLHSQAAHKKI